MQDANANAKCVGHIACVARQRHRRCSSRKASPLFEMHLSLSRDSGTSVKQAASPEEEEEQEAKKRDGKRDRHA